MFGNKYPFCKKKKKGRKVLNKTSKLRPPPFPGNTLTYVDTLPIKITFLFELIRVL